MRIEFSVHTEGKNTHRGTGASSSPATKEKKPFKSLFFNGLLIHSRTTSVQLLKSSFKWHDLVFYTTLNVTVYFNLLIHSREIRV